MLKKRKNIAKNTTKNIKSKTKVVKQKVDSKVKKVTGKSTGTMSKKKRIILNILLVCVIFFIALILIFFAYVIIKSPKFDPNNLKFTEMTEIYDSDVNIIAKLGNENRTGISYDDLPEVLIDAIIATEDSKFFQHNGFDLGRFTVASVKQALRMGGGGASTLTMQIVKNNYTSTTSHGFEGILRKFTDIYLSVFKVEKKYTKKQILEFYVNDSYLGNGSYGVEQASLNYFGKHVSELNLSEASFIAGLFQAPSSYDPYTYPDAAESRRKTVLYLMERHGYITSEERKIAQANPITDYITDTKHDNSYSEYQGYVDTVVEELQNEYDINAYTTPLKIYTSMNKSKQDYVNKVMNGETWDWENDLVESGVVMTESDTGEVIAVGAGRNKDTKLSYNFATMTNRQIGSTAKPIFDYGPAVEYLGYGTVTYINDEPHSYSNGPSMSNFDGGYYGIMPMYQALGLSRNVPALKTFQEVSKNAGNDKIVSFVTGLGITPEIEDGKIHEAHSIGAFTGSTKTGESRTSPMTMAGAYQAFSNGGYYVKPHTIKKFVYKDTGETTESNYTKTRVMNDSTAYIINYALHWGATEGMAKTAANVSGVTVAAKTGTSNFDDATIAKYKLYNSVNDLWVCGYTPKYTLTMWYGYDQIYTEYYSTTNSWKQRDGLYRNLATNLFDKDTTEFEVPSSFEAVKVVKDSIPLKLASSSTPESMRVTGYFRKGTAPTLVDETESTLPSVTGASSKVTGSTVKLSWTGITAEQMLNITSQDGYGSLGYDIYVKDGDSGTEKYLGTTTSNTYTNKTTYSNPVYVIYTAFANHKDNKSNGVTIKASIAADFEVNAENITVEQNAVMNNATYLKDITVLYNSVDVTAQSSITHTATVDTSTLGSHEITYSVTYSGTTKTIKRTITVVASQTTTNP